MFFSFQIRDTDLVSIRMISTDSTSTAYQPAMYTEELSWVMEDSRESDETDCQFASLSFEHYDWSDSLESSIIQLGSIVYIADWYSVKAVSADIIIIETKSVSLIGKEKEHNWRDTI